MKELKPTSQYKKDYKKFRNNTKKLKKLFNILELLQQGSRFREKTGRTSLLVNMPGTWNVILRGISC